MTPRKMFRAETGTYYEDSKGSEDWPNFVGYLYTPWELKDEMRKCWEACAEQCAVYFESNNVKATVTPPFKDYWQQKFGGGEK